MKLRYLILLFLMVFTATNSRAQSVKRVLFLGNSYTYYNNLPQLFADVAHSAGDSVIFDSNLIGGYTLQNHSTDATSLAKIMSGGWDMIVLQEQSQLPSFPISQVQSSVYPYARQLDSLIHVYNPCAETVFFMTWGRKTGDASNCAIWPPVCTYEGMDSLLRARYLIMADNNNGVVSPVGPVWHYIRNQNPALELYQTDLSHPSLAGSYAAACAFYASIFRKNPMLISNDGGVAAADAALIRNAAKSVAFDSLSTWFVGTYDPQASFNYNINGGTVTFTSTSLNGTNFIWNFGDGNSGIGDVVAHTYTQGGTYAVTLTVENCGLASSFSDTISFSATGLNEMHESTLWHYDAIGQELIFQQNLMETELMIYDLSGRMLIHKNLVRGTNRIALNFLQSGMYVVRTNSVSEKNAAKLFVPSK